MTELEGRVERLEAAIIPAEDPLIIVVLAADDPEYLTGRRRFTSQAEVDAAYPGRDFICIKAVCDDRT